MNWKFWGSRAAREREIVSVDVEVDPENLDNLYGEDFIYVSSWRTLFEYIKHRALHFLKDEPKTNKDLLEDEFWKHFQTVFDPDSTLPVLNYQRVLAFDIQHISEWIQRMNEIDPLPQGEDKGENVDRPDPLGQILALRNSLSKERIEQLETLMRKHRVANDANPHPSSEK